MFGNRPLDTITSALTKLANEIWDGVTKCRCTRFACFPLRSIYVVYVCAWFDRIKCRDWYADTMLIRHHKPYSTRERFYEPLLLCWWPILALKIPLNGLPPPTRPPDCMMVQWWLLASKYMNFPAPRLLDAGQPSSQCLHALYSRYDMGFVIWEMEQTNSYSKRTNNLAVYFFCVENDNGVVGIWSLCG